MDNSNDGQIKVSKNIKTKFKNKFKVKFKLNNYLQGHDDIDPFGLLAIEKFFTSNHLLITPSIEDFLIGNKPLKNKIMVWLHITLQWIVNVRFITLAVVNEFIR